MFIIVGLGNPGEKYQNTRHNAGFQAADELAANFQFPSWREQAVFNAEVSKGTIGNQKVIIAKPQTFMNNSGKAAKLLLKNHIINNTMVSLVILHDDIDLPVGEFKMQKNRGAAGHKGAQSVIAELGTKDFWRLRIGICPKTGKPKDPEKFVLQKFSKEEKEIIKETTKKSATAVKNLIIENENLG